MHRVRSLLAGYRTFREGKFAENAERYGKLAARQQHPKAIIICCCDSRADPAMILDAEPGELFVIRNVANLVPPYAPDAGYHGTSAALEFGVLGLDIAHIVVMGHARCGGIKALRESLDGAAQGEFVGPWMSIARDRARQVIAEHGDKPEAELLAILERQSVLRSLDALRSFPFVREREAAGTLYVHGWFFDIASGELSVYDAEEGRLIAAEKSAVA